MSFVWFLIGLREDIVEPRESGKPAVGFALFLGPSRLWECGNRAAISKGGGKGGKPDFGFPGFPRAVISIAVSPFRFSCISIMGSKRRMLRGSALILRKKMR